MSKYPGKKPEGGRWTCRQHSDACKSYVNAGEDFNERGITPDSIPDDEKEYAFKCLKWIPDNKVIKNTTERHLGKKPLSFEEFKKAVGIEGLFFDQRYRIYLVDFHLRVERETAQELEEILHNWSVDEITEHAAFAQINEVARKLRVSAGGEEK